MATYYSHEKIMSKTFAEWRALASGQYRKREDSWDRSDTDGFLSQWAFGFTAKIYTTCANVAENGGLAGFPLLFDKETDEQVPAVAVDGKYGRVWLLTDEAEARYGRRFIPFDGSHNGRGKYHDGRKISRSKVQRDLGLEQRSIDLPAAVTTESSGTGLSGNAWVVVKIDKKAAADSGYYLGRSS